MKNKNPGFNDDTSRAGFSELTPIEQKLLDLYWHKKELEEFLPQISKYATPKELTAITLSQLAMMEKQIVQTLQMLCAQNPSESL